MSILIYHPSKTADYVRLLREQGFEAPLIPCHNRQELESAIESAEVLFCWRFPSDLFLRARNLRWVQAMGAGIEDLVRAPLPDGTILTRVEGLFGGFMSEYILGYILHHTLQVGRALEAQRDRRWEPYTIGRVEGKRLGVAGLGSIGGTIARKARALGMEVWGLSRSGQSADVDRAFRTDDVREFAAGVDYLANVLPVTPETERLFDAGVFGAMRQGALFLNIGRGQTVDDAALVEAVRSGHLGGAVLDVFDVEPLPVESPLWSTPGILVTPHSSGPSVPAEVAAYFLANHRRWQAGEPLTGVVDRERGY